MNDVKYEFHNSLQTTTRYFGNEVDHLVSSAFGCVTYILSEGKLSYVSCVISDETLDPVGSTVRYEMMKLCTGSAFGYLCLYIMNKVGIWRDVTDPLLTDSLTDLER